MACPAANVVAEHYRADGSCRCDDPTHRLMQSMGYEWDSLLYRWIKREAK